MVWDESVSSTHRFGAILLGVFLIVFIRLIEWAAASVFGGDLGQAYLGSQGDVWDAHKDMALAGVGAVIAMTLSASVNMRYQRDFAREFRDSLRIKHAEPVE